MRCGGCNYCCDLPAIPELKKSANVVCEHCIPDGGCDIWESRPDSCRRFFCLWYKNPKWPDSLRPDHCGAIFEPVIDEEIMFVNVHYSRPDAWTSGVASKLIEKCLTDGWAVIVIVDQEKHMLLPEGVTQCQVMDGVERQAKKMGLVA